MPLFRSHHEREPSPEPVQETPNRKGSLFSRRYRSNSPTHDNVNVNSQRTHDDNIDAHNNRRGGLFSRRRSMSSSDESSSLRTGRSSMNSGRGNRLHNSKMSNDPSIITARQKVSDAEAAEREADKALVQSRSAVRAAKDHARNLEREIEEE